MRKLKKLLTHALVVLLALQGTVAALTINISHARAASQDVVINELMWMGSTNSAADEWIELRNTTNAPIDLTGWQLTHAATSSGTLTIPSGKTIAANGLFLISNFAQTDANSILNVAPDWVSTSVSLSNTCSSIDLMDSLNVVFDTMGCAGSSYLAGTNTTVKAAMERNVAVAAGTVAGSWHASVGFVNLDANAAPNNFATPALANDTTAPIAGTVAVTPAHYFDHATNLAANWQGFEDSESGIDSYQVGLSSNGTTADVVSFQSVAGTVASHTFDLTGMSLTENAPYYALVQATNGVGLNGNVVVSSPTVFRETTPPDAFTLVSVIDTPSDNGGSVDVSWNGSSLDVTGYAVQYQLHGGSWNSPLAKDAGLNLGATVTGLQNAPTSYDFRLKATSFNGTTTLSSNVLTGSALDNLPPVINGARLTLTQNAPGLSDTVSGQPGSSTEAGVANIYSVDPTIDPAALPIDSLPLGSDLSFLPIAIGDNQFGAIWARVVDQSGNQSQAVKLLNDIVAPNAPTLTKIDASCLDTCQVKLNWQDNGPDTLSYQIGYTAAGGTEQRSLKVTSTDATLTLGAGTGYDFVVYAFDGAGNVSAKSNSLGAQLTSGVATVVTLVNGSPVTMTTALTGAKEVTAVPQTAPFRATKVRAAEPTATPAGSTSTGLGSTATATTAAASSGDSWLKVLVIVGLLLVIAAGFYFLSRSYDDKTEDALAADSAPTSFGRQSKAPARRRSKTRKRPSPGS